MVFSLSTVKLSKEMNVLSYSAQKFNILGLYITVALQKFSSFSCYYCFSPKNEHKWPGKNLPLLASHATMLNLKDFVC